MAHLVPAVWNGPYDAELVDGTVLRPGDEALVAPQDLESGYWTPKPTARSRPPAKSDGRDS